MGMAPPTIYPVTKASGRVAHKLWWRLPKPAGAKSYPQRSIEFDRIEDAQRWQRTFAEHGNETGHRLYLIAESLDEQGRPLDSAAVAPDPPSAPSVTAGPRMPLMTAVLRSIEQNTRLQPEQKGTYRAIARNHIEPHLGVLGHHIDELDHERAVKWRNLIEKKRHPVRDKPLSGKTVFNIQIVLMDTCRWAAANHKITGVTHNATALLGEPPNTIPETDAIFLTARQIEQLYEVIQDDMHDHVLMLTATGIRFGELAGLQVRHIYHENGIVKIRIRQQWSAKGRRVKSTKSRNGVRWIQLVEANPAAQMLLGRVAGRDPEALVFTSPLGNRLNNGHFHRRRWMPAMKTLQAQYGWTIRPRPHDLRHTAASFMLQGGIDDTRVAAILGDSPDTVKDTYAHVSDAGAIAATNVLGDMLRQILTPSQDEDPLTPIAGGTEPESRANVIDMDAHRERRRPRAWSAAADSGQSVRGRTSRPLAVR